MTECANSLADLMQAGGYHNPAHIISERKKVIDSIRGAIAIGHSDE